MDKLLRDELFQEVLTKFKDGKLTPSQLFAYGVEYQNYSDECYNLEFYKKLFQHKAFKSFDDIYLAISEDSASFSRFLINTSLLDILKQHQLFDASNIEDLFWNCFFDKRLTSKNSIKYDKLNKYKIHETNFLNFCKNPELMLMLLTAHNDECSIRDFVDIMRTASPSIEFSEFLHDERTLIKLYNDRLMTDEDLLYIYNSCSGMSEFAALVHESSSYYNTSTKSMFVLTTLLDKKLITFEDIFKKFSDSRNLNILLSSSEFFEKAVQLKAFNASRLLQILKNTSCQSKDYSMYSLGRNAFFNRELISSGVLSFKELVDIYKKSRVGITEFLMNKKFFSYVRQDQLLSEDDLKYLSDELMSSDDLMKLNRNEELAFCLLKAKTIDLEKLIDSLLQLDSSYTLHELASNSSIFEFCVNEQLLNKEDIDRIYKKLSKHHIGTVIENRFLLEYIFDNNLTTFNEFVDACKEPPKISSNSLNLRPLWRFLNISSFFENLASKNKLNRKELEYLLEGVNNTYELSSICSNETIMNSLLKNEIYNKKLYECFVDSFSDRRHIFSHQQLTPVLLEYMLNVVRNITKDYDWLLDLKKSSKESEKILKDVPEGRRNFTTYLRYAKKYLNTEFPEETLTKLEAAELLGTFNFTTTQETELLKVLRSSPNALSRLEAISNNNLQDQYKYTTLLEVLTKDDEKKKIKMNF